MPVQESKSRYRSRFDMNCALGLRDLLGIGGKPADQRTSGYLGIPPGTPGVSESVPNLYPARVRDRVGARKGPAVFNIILAIVVAFSFGAGAALGEALALEWQRPNLARWVVVGAVALGAVVAARWAQRRAAGYDRCLRPTRCQFPGCPCFRRGSDPVAVAGQVTR